MFFVCFVFVFVFLLLFFEVVFKFKDVYVRINVYPGFQNLLSDMFTILFISYLYLTFIYYHNVLIKSASSTNYIQYLFRGGLHDSDTLVIIVEVSPIQIVIYIKSCNI